MNDTRVENLALEELTAIPRSSSSEQSRARLPADIDLIKHVQVMLTATIGTAEMSIEQLFSLRDGDVVALRELVNEPVILRIESRPVARGQLVAVDDHFGVEIAELIAP